MSSTAVDDKTEERLVYENKEGRWTQFWAHMKEMRRIEIMCDVNLKVNERQWAVHKIVLMTLSTYFKAMFTQDLKEKNETTIELHGLDAESVDLILDYAYTGIVEIRESNVQELLNVADLWNLEDVKEICSKFMAKILHPTNCLRIYSLAEKHSCSELLETSLQFAKENFVEVSHSDDFPEICFDQLRELVEREGVRKVSHENDIYDAIMRWTKHDLKERQSYLMQLLNFVQFELLTKERLQEIFRDEPLFQSFGEFRDLVTSAMVQRIFLLEDKLERVNRCKKVFMFVTRYFNDECFVYDPLKNVCAKTLPMLTGKRKGQAVAAVDHKIVVIGGDIRRDRVSSCEIFDPIENTWTMAAPMTVERKFLAACSINGLIYVSGGLDRNGSRIKSVECFDTSKNCWTMVPPMQFNRSSHNMVALGNYMYALGGTDGESSLNTAERFDTRTGHWEGIENMIKCRDGAGAMAFDGKLYVAGGINEDMLSSVECYDPEVGRWQYVASMTHSRFDFGLVEVRGCLYAVGGSNMRTIECYNPITNNWAIYKKSDHLRSSIRAASFACDESSLHFTE